MTVVVPALTAEEGLQLMTEKSPPIPPHAMSFGSLSKIEIREFVSGAVLHDERGADADCR